MVTSVKLTCLCCDIHVNTDIYIFLLTKISSCLLQYLFVVYKKIKLPVAMTLPDEHLHATKKQTETAEILKNLIYLIEQLMKLLGVH